MAATVLDDLVLADGDVEDDPKRDPPEPVSCRHRQEGGIERPLQALRDLVAMDVQAQDRVADAADGGAGQAGRVGAEAVHHSTFDDDGVGLMRDADA